MQMKYNNLALCHKSLIFCMFFIKVTERLRSMIDDNLYIPSTLSWTLVTSRNREIIYMDTV